jgi:hypothetical protein
MRYLLIFAGLLGGLFGVWVIGYGHANAGPLGSLFVQVGAIFLAVGLATVDIVEAIMAQRR